MQRAKLLHQETSVAPLTLGLIHYGFHQGSHKKYTSPLVFKNSFVVYEHHQIDWCGDWDKFQALGQQVIDGIKKDPVYSAKLFSDTKQQGDKLEQECRKINKLNIERLSNNQLAASVKNLADLSYKINDFGLVAVLADLRHNMLTNILNNIIKQKIAGHLFTQGEKYYLSSLITINKTTYSQREKSSFLAIARDVKKNRKLSSIFKKESEENIEKTLHNNYPKIYSRLRALQRKYEWLIFGHLGPAKSMNQYLMDIKNILPGHLLEQELKTAKNENQQIKATQKKLTAELHLTSEERNLFHTARDFSYNKLYRFDVLLYTYYTLDKLLREISKRVSFSVRELRYMTPEEIVGLLQKKKEPTRAEITKRREHCVAVVRGKNLKLLSGQEARRYVNKHMARTVINKKLTTIHGSVAYTGQVTGTVKIVNSSKDIDKIAVGDVLVSIQTNPDLVPAMKQASAFVTDVGGITSHAAIIARELKKPCVIGTKIATRALKDGDRVEVDANTGKVKKL